jgi:hypothetical protein
MAVSAIPMSKMQFFDDNGDPLASGTVGFYVPSTLTFKQVYQDSAGTIAWPLAVITLNARGESAYPIYGSGNFRVILKTAAGVTIWDTDYVSSFQKEITYADIIAALGYVPVDPAGNTTFTGNNTFNGTTEYNGSVESTANATFSCESVQVTSDNLNNLDLISTDAGATVSLMDLYRNSVSPAANDDLFGLNFEGNNSTPAKKTFAQISVRALGVTAAAESGRVDVQTVVSGTLALRFSIANGLFATGLTDSGAGTINATGYWRSGTALPIQRSFASAYQALPAAGGLLTIAHGLSVAPDPTTVRAKLKNVSGGTVAGWADGDEFTMPLQTFDGGSTNIPGGVVVYTDNTNIYLRRCSSGALFTLLDKSSGSATAITEANWNIQLLTWA